MNNTYNLRNPQGNEVKEMHTSAKEIREKKIRYKLLSQLLNGKEIDVTKSNSLFEALNRERMEFDELLRLHPDHAQDCIDQAKDDREAGRNTKSKAKWAIKGHIPPCCYYARPEEYWKDKKILDQFFRMYPKFRVMK